MLTSLYAVAALIQLTYASDPLSYHGGSILAMGTQVTRVRRSSYCYFPRTGRAAAPADVAGI